MADNLAQTLEQQIKFLPTIENGIRVEDFYLPDNIDFVSEHVNDALKISSATEKSEEPNPNRLYPINNLSDMGTFTMFGVENQIPVSFLIISPSEKGKTRAELIKVEGSGMTLAHISKDNLPRNWEVKQRQTKLIGGERETVVTFPATPDYTILEEGKSKIIQKGGYKQKFILGVTGTPKNCQAWAIVNTDYLPGGRIGLEHQKLVAQGDVGSAIDNLKASNTILSVTPEDAGVSIEPPSPEADVAEQIQVGETIHR